MVKRIGDLYGNVFDMRNLELAHRNARKGKGWYAEVKNLEKDLHGGLKNIQHLLINHEYVTSDYEMFIKCEGNKERKIYKLPYYPDRIVQWALMQVVSPYIERHLIRDTYSAIPNRGIHDGLRRVQDAMYWHKDDCRYCLKFDVRHYYQNIVHDILFMQYCRMFKDEELLWLIHEIINSINTFDEEDEWEMVLADLEVIYSCGVPIGNYFSQWSGNFYLSVFDHWLKEVIGIKYYYRYMDDCVILHGDKDFLHELRFEIEKYLWQVLHLRLKENWQIFPSYVRGVDYLGYRVFDGYTLLRKKTIKNIKDNCKYIGKKTRNGCLMSYSDFCSLNSHLGWTEQANCFRFNQKHIYPFEENASLFYRDVIWMGDLK